MKLAYLIIAHNEFGILQRLLDSLDDERNDIFIHFDKKVTDIPNVSVSKSGLFVLDNRVDVRWGTVSQIESEYALFEAAARKGEYDYYILISGTHLPLKTQDFFHGYFDSVKGKEVMRLWPEDAGDADFKLRRYHFGLRNYNSSHPAVRWLVQHIWTANMKVQKVFRIRHYESECFVKTDNWVCLTDAAIRFLIGKKREILKKYRYSFCGDEYFAATELSLRPDSFRIEDCKNLLYVEFDGANPRALQLSEYEGLTKTPYLFARKFTSVQRKD